LKTPALRFSVDRKEQYIREMFALFKIAEKSASSSSGQMLIAKWKK